MIAKEYKNLKKNGYVYFKNDSLKPLIKEVRKIVNKNFSKKTSYYNSLSDDKFKKKLVLTLNNIKKINPQKYFKKYFKGDLEKLTNEKQFSICSYVNFHGVRPKKKNKSNKVEYIDFHRESFYCDKKYINHQLNVWIPIFDLEKKSNLKYIPKSHLIPDKKIKVKKIKNFPIKKFSKGHELGLPYAPKKIVAGVDLKKKTRFNLPKDHLLVFSSKLIHGGGENLSKKTRFTLVTGIIPKKYVNAEAMKKNFRSGLSHYINL
tara:strand:+ start:530 stop:1312 length:783 start_codon:yes stop_codon:yes gene_type:complete